MWRSNKLSLSSLISKTARHFVENANSRPYAFHPKLPELVKVPSCADCIHYIEYTNDYPWNDVPANTFKKCGKFSGKNKLTGETKTIFISVCREDKNKCGEQGRFFEAKKEIEKRTLII